PGQLLEVSAVSGHRVLRQVALERQVIGEPADQLRLGMGKVLPRLHPSFQVVVVECPCIYAGKSIQASHERRALSVPPTAVGRTMPQPPRMGHGCLALRLPADPTSTRPSAEVRTGPRRFGSILSAPGRGVAGAPPAPRRPNPSPRSRARPVRSPDRAPPAPPG